MNGFITSQVYFRTDVGPYRPQNILAYEKLKQWKGGEIHAGNLAQRLVFPTTLITISV